MTISKLADYFHNGGLLSHLKISNTRPGLTTRAALRRCLGDNVIHICAFNFIYAEHMSVVDSLSHIFYLRQLKKVSYPGLTTMHYRIKFIVLI